jgi:ribosomal protein L11 methyltransferase
MPFTDYIEYKISVALTPEDIGMEIALEERQEIIISELSEMPFESFQIENQFVLTYIQAEKDMQDMEPFIRTLAGVLQIEKRFIKGENWNQLWEESFEPITIGDTIIVKAPFHSVDKKFIHEIIIEPKMSFGTGHHSTTRLMMESMQHLHFENRSVLDMGCGTGILAILAAKLGSRNIMAVDHDPQCIKNTLENISLNNCQHIGVCLNEEISANFKTDIILANIQKNVLIDQMPLYFLWLNKGGQLLVSGIYEEAVKHVVEAAKQNGLGCKDQKTNNEWCMIHFEKLI